MAENKYVIDKRKGEHKQNNFIFGLIDKIKKVKHLDVILGVACVGIALLICVSFFGGENNSQTQTISNESDYLKIESRLCEVLSDIEGAGKVNVMINFAGTSELVTATESNKSEDKTVDTSTSGDRTTESKTESTSPVIIQQSGEDTPLIVKEILPDIVGVIVVAEGAGSMSVRIDLLQAVQTLLNVSSDKVEIFTMK